MINIEFKYADKKFVLHPYNTATEKELLILDSLDQSDLKSALLTLGLTEDEVKDLTYEEQVAILLKLRSISVGEEIPIKYKCKVCNAPNEVQINCEDNIYEPDTDLKINQKFKEVTEENLHEFIDIENIEEMDIDEYKELFENVKRSVIKFIFAKESRCIKCGQINMIDLSEGNKVLDYMSEDSLVSLYQTYNDLVFFSHYTKEDVDSMLPFERTIFVGLLNKTREELNK